MLLQSDVDLTCPRHAKMALWLMPGFGVRSYYQLIDRVPIERIFSLSRAQLESLAINPSSVDWILSPDWAALRYHFNWLLRNPESHHLIFIDEPEYPFLLKQIANPPFGLSVRGNLSLIHQPQIAVVGSRKATPTGRSNAHYFASEISRVGIIVTSGMALGVDTCAHQGALSAGGNTIAVVGNGLDTVYPAQNRELALKIVNNGAIVSEFALNAMAKSQHFPQRNRIISGLSLGTLVVEAATRSGSLITAYMAVEQNREVFAIPGSIHNVQSSGCLDLIRNGAKLTSSISDILEEFPAYHFAQAAEKHLDKSKRGKILTAEERLLLKCIGEHPVSSDQIILQSGLPPAKVYSLALQLELGGYITSKFGGFSLLRT